MHRDPKLELQTHLQLIVRQLPQVIEPEKRATLESQKFEYLYKLRQIFEIENGHGVVMVCLKCGAIDGISKYDYYRLFNGDNSNYICSACWLKEQSTKK